MSLAMPEVKENWTGRIVEVTLGAGPDQGGTRGSTVTVGGETTLPFLHFEGAIPHRPVIAVEVSDRSPDDWSPLLQTAWAGVLGDPAAWAARAEEAGAEVIALALDSAHPERGDTGASRGPQDGAARCSKPLRCRSSSTAPVRGTRTTRCWWPPRKRPPASASPWATARRRTTAPSWRRRWPTTTSSSPRAPST